MDNRDNTIIEVSKCKEYGPNLGGNTQIRPEPHGFTTTTETLKEVEEDEDNMHGGERGRGTERQQVRLNVLEKGDSGPKYAE